MDNLFIVLIVLVILIILKKKSKFANINNDNKSLIFYCYYEDSKTKKNLEYFVKYGLINSDKYQYKIIVNNLKRLDIRERPIHCTDLKRETVYVKEDNKWEKQEKAREKLQFLIDEVQKKNIKLLPQFKEKYPDYNNSDSIYSDQYSKIVI